MSESRFNGRLPLWIGGDVDAGGGIAALPTSVGGEPAAEGGDRGREEKRGEVGHTGGKVEFRELMGMEGGGEAGHGVHLPMRRYM